MTPDDNGPVWYHLSFGATKGAPADKMWWAVLSRYSQHFSTCPESDVREAEEECPDCFREQRKRNLPL